MKKTIVLFTVCCMMLQLFAGCGKKGTQVIAHRGYWDCEGSAQNSIASIKNAARVGVFGAEFDVNMTPDSVLIINHDQTFHGHLIKETPYAVIKDSLLSNGEKLPLLKEYLEAAKAYPKLKMIFELKTDAGSELERIAIQQSMEMIKEMGMEKQMVFISFSLVGCQKMAELMPNNEVQYLGGKIAPAELKQLGIMGLDYHYSQFIEHPEWVKEAHDLGMSVNVWTVNKEEMMQQMIDLGVDYITTDKPEVVASMI